MIQCLNDVIVLGRRRRLKKRGIRIGDLREQHPHTRVHVAVLFWNCVASTLKPTMMICEEQQY